MAYYGDNQTIHIKTKGSAPASFTSATFKATIQTFDKTGPAAKEAAKERVAAIWAVIEQFGEKAGIEKDRLRTTFSVDSHREHNRTTGEVEFKGYKATYTITFRARNVMEATNLHDALTSINGIESPSPVFNIDESPEIYQRAFDEAFKAAQVKFEKQLSCVGQYLRFFELRTWAIEEEQQHGKMLSAANGPTAKAVGVEPGRAVLEMTVTFVYGPKASEDQPRRPPQG